MTAQVFDQPTDERMARIPAPREAPAGEGSLSLRVEYGPIGVATVRVAGEIDLLNAPRFQELVLCRLRSGLHGVVLDLSEVEFMSVAGARVLAHVATYAHAGNTELRIDAEDSRAVRRVLRATGIRKQLPLHEGA